MIAQTWGAVRADVRRLVGKYALHPIVLLPGLVLLSLGTAFADTQNLNRYNEGWVIVALQSFVAACAVFFVLGVPVRLATGVWRTVEILILYATTELVRTLVVESAALERGLIQTTDWTTQSITALSTGLTIYGVASLAVNNAGEFRSTVADLKMRTALLQTTLARTELDANVARREILRSAKATIRAALKKTLAKDSTEETVRALLDVSDDVVRPLSRQLMYRPGTFAGIQPTPVRTRFQFWEVVDLASSTKPFRPGATVLVGGMLSLGAAATAAPYGLGILALVALLAIPFSILWFADRFLTNRLRARGRMFRFFAVCAVYIVACGSDAVIVGFVNGLAQPLLTTFVCYATVMGMLILWYLATMIGVRRGYDEVIEQITEVNRRLEWAVARVNARLWTDQKELSRILHNEVQGVLVATAFKLQRDWELGKALDVDPDVIRATVLDALESPSAPSATPVLQKTLADEVERWHGVLAISWDIDDASFACVNADRDARRVIGDLISEFMTNAVKHGRAHNATVWMRPTSRGTMDLSLYNDGAPMPKDRVPGLGVELAYSISVSLRLPPRSKGVELRIEIPCEEFEAPAPSSSRVAHDRRRIS